VLGSVSSNFSDIVTIGERIEHELKSEKLAQGASAATGVKKSGFNPSKKKEGEVQAASTVPYWGGYRSQYLPNYRPSSAYVANAMPGYSQNTPRSPTAYRPPFTANNVFQPNVRCQSFTQAQSPGYGQKNNNSGGKVVNFTPLPMTYTELLPDLLKNSLLVLCLAKVVQPPYPRYYDPNAKCEYHSGEVGHSTENYRALKYKVKSLIDSKWLTFQDQKLSVEQNPLSGHTSSTNAIMEEGGPILVRSIYQMKKPMSEVFEAICQAGLFQYECKSEDECGFHACTTHSIDECGEFKDFVQDLMDRHVLQVCHQRKEGEVFIGEERLPQRPKPLVIQFTKAATPMPSGRQPLVIQTPSPFAYKDNKVVPWSYGVSIVQGEQKEESVEQGKTTIDNISGIRGMTRSGRLFAHPDLRGETSYKKNREEMAMEKAKSYLKGKAVQVDS